MTNFEYYREKILDIAEKCDCGIAIINNRIVPCDDTKCYMCQFSQTTSGCEQNLLKWLYAEYIPQSVLTKEEHELCKLIETGYIARDLNNDLYWYPATPQKINTCWKPCDGICKRLDDWLPVKLDFITWGDKEPWSVENLLKLEVKQNE